MNTSGMQNDENTPLVERTQESSSLWTWERKVIVGLNCYNAFMWSVYYTVIVPLLPFIAQSYGFDEFMQGVVLASLQVGWFLGLPLVNTTVLKPRTMLYMGATAYALAPAVVAFHPELWTILLGRVIEGFGSCILMVLMTSVLAREIPEEIRGFAFGLRAFVGGFGLLGGPVAGGLLYPLGGIRLIMIILTVLSCIGLVIYIVVTPDHWFDSYEARIAAAEAEGISMFSRFKNLLDERVLRWLLSVHFFSWAFLGIMFMAVPHFMVHEWKLDTTVASLCWLACDISKAIGAFVGGLLVDSLNSWDVFFVGLCFQHVLQFVLVALTIKGHIELWVFVLAGVFVFGTTEDGVLGPAYMKILTTFEATLSKLRAVKDQQRYEEILSTMELLTAVAMVIGPLYAGAMYPVFGFALTIFFFAILSSIMDCCSAILTRELRSVPEPQADKQTDSAA
eukprot:gnl/TRDRNA2_/TRDRNA2_38382_c0_seq1.p1 gnl/TRDRNA2_/TRDRNA2_38382_c0~~gnl/TRDRNA2_/TRDRNA2_38382_c0_seq1.p1  ORF type:complete len:450 (+),score=37.73 gnl/TRDRNA2_/TRDRNA2_38382_c0_seq1:93-1442(+)